MQRITIHTILALVFSNQVRVTRIQGISLVFFHQGVQFSKLGHELHHIVHTDIADLRLSAGIVRQHHEYGYNRYCK